MYQQEGERLKERVQWVGIEYIQRILYRCMEIEQ
jgi:hypothetical protein